MKISDEGKSVKTLVARTAYDDDGSPYEIPAGTIGMLIVGGDVEFSIRAPNAQSDLDYDFPMGQYKDHELELVDD